MARYGFGLLLLVLPLHLLAQLFAPSPDWRFENYNSQNHFISREIENLTLDKYGYVWACSTGVQQFDGYKTVEFNSFGRAGGSLRANYTDIASDNNGRIWVSSAGLCYYNDANGKFIYIKADIKHTITYVQAFLVQNNYLWFICNYGLARLDLSSLKISFTSLAKVTDPLGIFLTDANNLFVSSREKVYSYNIQHDTYAANTLIYNSALLKVFSMAKNGTDTFLGTNHGLFLLKDLYKVIPVNNETRDIELNDMLFLPADKEKTYLFLATDGKGIIVYNTRLKRIAYRYGVDEANPFSLPNNIINKFYTDKNGRLWIATGAGISMLDVDNQQMKTRFFNRINSGDFNINKIAPDRADSNLVWMSSYTQGVVCMNWKTKEIERRYNTVSEILKVHDFVQLSNNQFLLATQNKIVEWDRHSGIRLTRKLPVPDSNALRFTIRRIIATDGKTYYVTTNRGLFKYDLVNHDLAVVSPTGEFKNPEEALKYDLSNGFYDKGLLWIASRNGLFSYNVATKATTVYRGSGIDADYFLFDVCNAGPSIISAAGDGITIFNKKTRDFTVINQLAGMYKPDCVSVTCKNNLVWISSEAGILYYNLTTHESTKAEREIPQMQTFPGSPFTTINNNIVIGFRNGYAYFAPHLKTRPLPSKPIIEDVFINNRSVLKYFDPAVKAPELIFNHSENSINIVFTAFSYFDPDHIDFRYKLKGTDADWQYTQNQRSANYAQLPPGNYTFYIQCGNKSGDWNSHIASMGFTILSPYWQTWWFKTLVVLLIAIGLYNLYRYKIRHIMAIERLREKIASDFHDDIGSALSSISIFSEVADKQLKQHSPPEQIREVVGHISFHSRAMLDAMDDIVWAVNPQNDHFNDLAVRMREYAIPLLEAKDINFTIDIQESIMATRLKMDVRKNIFLIFKECVNNILKHSGCSAMRVGVNKLNNQLEMIISDDGSGFDVNKPKSRNGLKNMQRRAAEINGDLHITSGNGDGTTLRLLVNII